jgi:hypothetical protein
MSSAEGGSSYGARRQRAYADNAVGPETEKQARGRILGWTHQARFALSCGCKATRIEVVGLLAGAVPGRWFGVHVLQTPNRLARHELGLGANANTSEDALW